MKVFLGLGSNQGNRRAWLRQAVRSLRTWPDAEVVGVSGLYESAYVGPGEQAPYLNACVALTTAVGPAELLERARDLEREAGRPVGSHMQPRSLDVDILLYGDQELRSDDLEVPHPRLAQRRFVLEPLAELAAELVLPRWDATPRTLLKAAPVQRQSVAKIADTRWCHEEAP